MGKIVVLWSSANDDGLTAAAKDSFIAGLAGAGAEHEEIWLNGMQLQHCRACDRGYGKCAAEGSCVIGDDFSGIYDRLKGADGVVLITAVYWHDLTEQMKAFMDRLRRCEAMQNHFLKDKECVLVACAGGTGNGVTECLHSMEEYCRHIGMHTNDRIPVVRYSRGYMVPVLEGAGETFAGLCR